ncbi:FAD:protein FMN transferase [Amnibacterium sp. CER49]|uniref:FAD:protein FMN transferase n=1 Tax=Amnibacterium sp. CER49 TaxID=3039161 RepID=UPI002448239D|nr:FAD:protein FMN transferase [Amnibacterium sp. CER49]MDH2444595.1 FAD:protein FMN transferase [Amnibacterium sp. CER49]
MIESVRPGTSGPEPTRAVQHVMGTVVSYDLRGGGDHAGAVAAARRWFEEVDARFSTYREDSEVRRFSRGEVAEPSPDLRAVIAACQALARATGGLFDATPADGWFDPSACVKGWSVDRAALLLAEHGVTDFSLNAGGDVLTRGRPGPGARWRVGIQHPFERGALATLVEGTDLAVATSGTYERGAHLRDPRTGLAATGPASVTVCATDLATADAWSTAAFALGDDAAAWLAAQPGLEALVITLDGRTVRTAGFPTGSPVPIRALPAAPPLPGVR